MLTFLRAWLMSVIAASLLLSLLNSLLPEGTPRTIARMTGGLVLLLVILRPVTQLDLSGLDLHYGACTQQINQQIAAYQEENEAQMRTIIERRTAEYISDKARQLGLTCEAAVTAEEQESGVFSPVGATLSIEKNQELSDYIASELGIPAARQQWKSAG